MGGPANAFTDGPGIVPRLSFPRFSLGWKEKERKRKDGRSKGGWKDDCVSYHFAPFPSFFRRAGLGRRKKKNEKKRDRRKIKRERKKEKEKRKERKCRETEVPVPSTSFLFLPIPFLPKDRSPGRARRMFF